MLFKIFSNLAHQTTQYLNLMDSFRGDKIFFETLPTNSFDEDRIESKRFKKIRP